MMFPRHSDFLCCMEYLTLVRAGGAMALDYIISALLLFISPSEAVLIQSLGIAAVIEIIRGISLLPQLLNKMC